MDWKMVFVLWYAKNLVLKIDHEDVEVLAKGCKSESLFETALVTSQVNSAIYNKSKVQNPDVWSSFSERKNW